MYFARFRVRGKLIRKSLKTDRISIAKLRLFASCPMATPWSRLAWTNCAFGVRHLSRRSRWPKIPSEGVNEALSLATSAVVRGFSYDIRSVAFLRSRELIPDQRFHFVFSKTA